MLQDESLALLMMCVCVIRGADDADRLVISSDEGGVD